MPVRYHPPAKVLHFETRVVFADKPQWSLFFPVPLPKPSDFGPELADLDGQLASLGHGPASDFDQPIATVQQRLEGAQNGQATHDKRAAACLDWLRLGYLERLRGYVEWDSRWDEVGSRETLTGQETGPAEPDLSASLAAFERALQACPAQMSGVSLCLASMEMAVGKLESPRQRYEKYLEVSKPDAPYRDLVRLTIGDMQRRAGQWEEAFQTFLDVATNTADPDIRYMASFSVLEIRFLQGDDDGLGTGYFLLLGVKPPSLWSHTRTYLFDHLAEVMDLSFALRLWKRYGPLAQRPLARLGARLLEEGTVQSVEDAAQLFQHLEEGARTQNERGHYRGQWILCYRLLALMRPTGFERDEARREAERLANEFSSFSLLARLSGGILLQSQSSLVARFAPVQGGATKANLSRSIGRSIPGLRQCFERALRSKSPPDEGLVTVKLTLAPDTELALEVQSPTLPLGFLQCVRERLTVERWPAAQRPLVVEIPFLFTAE